jgi:hypothetical protein
MTYDIAYDIHERMQGKALLFWTSIYHRTIALTKSTGMATCRAI